MINFIAFSGVGPFFAIFTELSYTIYHIYITIQKFGSRFIIIII